MKSEATFPKALPPPSEDVVLSNDTLIQQGVEASRNSPRKRIILPIHNAPSDTLHRMLNIVQPMSYIQPHRHIEPPKVESFVALKGAVLFEVKQGPYQAISDKDFAPWAPAEGLAEAAQYLKRLYKNGKISINGWH